MTKKILVFSQYFWPENFIINELSKNLSNNFDVEVLTAKPNYPKGYFYKGYNFFNKFLEIKDKIKVYRAPIFPRFNSNKFQLFLNYSSFLISSFFFLLFFRKKKYDFAFIFATSPLITLISIYFLKRYLNIKITLWLQDLWPNVVQKKIKIQFIYNLILKMSKYILINSDYIFVQNDYYKKYLNKNYNISLSRMDVVYNWSKIENFFDIRLKENNPNKFIFTGNIGEAQNLDVLINISKMLNDLNIKIDIYGEGRYKKKLIIKLNELDNKNICFYPYLDQDELNKIIKDYDAAIITLAPDFFHTIPLKFQYYLSQGMPILGSIDGEVNSLINSNNIGLCCKANNENDFAKIFKKFTELNFNDKKTMANNCLHLYRNVFSKQINQSKIINYFKNEV